MYLLILIYLSFNEWYQFFFLNVFKGIFAESWEKGVVSICVYTAFIILCPRWGNRPQKAMVISHMKYALGRTKDKDSNKTQKIWYIAILQVTESY